ncbi:hypothetical protein CEV34_4763 [Brucella pseudogrignonensis]|uniref:Uncharacterized protein n=1 Tax=Brucella pseudogrignonensis TaxID=419475 RepID=A0A256G4E9_9HYPH|nr:hypothetical protein CEV34_4763 [Brucella pseudogrignonensis]
MFHRGDNCVPCFVSDVTVPKVRNLLTYRRVFLHKLKAQGG